MNAARQACKEMGKSELASTDTIWTPDDNYHYQLLPSKKVKRYVLGNAGAGKPYQMDKTHNPETKSQGSVSHSN
jgi:pectate lyase